MVFLTAACALAAPAAAEDASDGWPREIRSAHALVVMYQPQIDRLDGNDLYARAAVSVTPEGSEEPVFGAAWIETRIETDFDTRRVAFSDIRVPQVRFPEASEEQEQGLIDLLVAEMPGWELEMSLDRLMAAVEVAEVRLEVAEGFDDTAPEILFREEPTVLVSIDGEPLQLELEDTGVQAVANAPFLIVQDPDRENDYYLYAGAETWYRAPAVKGPWAVAKKVPKKIRRLEPEEKEIGEEETDKDPSEPPAILVATEPTELIVTEGKPRYQPLAGGELLVVTNTESDVIKEIATQRTFVLLSGRWFSAEALEGPWTFVPSDRLPPSFARIEPDSDWGYLLTWVAGTEMATEAILDAAVPQTAAVKRDATIQVTYDGAPQFEPVEGTTLDYAVNTRSQVIRSGSTYYCVEEGIWYKALAPLGPWTVATEVPEEVRKIPPSSPVYNIKYVYIYDTTPEVVYVGYYPGYLGSYHYHGCLVYGTGWYYRPWWGSYYYPRYRTWGFSVRWNPWYGWSFGLSYSTGRFTFSIGFGGWHGGGWWGPAGYRGYRHGYHRGWHHGYRAGAAAGYRAGYRAAQQGARQNLYNSKSNADRVAHTGRRPGGDGSRDRRPATTERPNNVYTDRNGNVYRQQPDGSWQGREDGSWKDTDIGQIDRSRGDAAGGPRDRAGSADLQRPSTGEARAPSAGSVERPSTGDLRAPSAGSSQRPSTGGSRYSGGSSLGNDARARQRGSQRSSAYGGAARSYGGGRGGGGRRGGGRR